MAVQPLTLILNGKLNEYFCQHRKLFKVALSEFTLRKRNLFVSKNLYFENGNHRVVKRHVH